jgi:ribonuclease HI
MSIYTDGSCLKPSKKSSGPSGWAFCVIENNEEWLMNGGEPSSTNNRMEMMAIIEALQFVSGHHYKIYTDSKLVMNCAQGKWKRKANLDLWKEYDKASKKKKLEWIWVKGHNGNKYNEIVDKLAKEAAKEELNVKKKS